MTSAQKIGRSSSGEQTTAHSPLLASAAKALFAKDNSCPPALAGGLDKGAAADSETKDARHQSWL